jgi:hypothetical protein
MTKALVSAPPLLWVRPLPVAHYRELWLTLEVMGLPWLVSLFLVIRHAVRLHRRRLETNEVDVAPPTC